MDLSQFSTDDLKAMQSGDLTKVSSAALKTLRTMQTREQIDNDPISQGARNFKSGDSFGQNVVEGIGRGAHRFSMPRPRRCLTPKAHGNHRADT